MPLTQEQKDARQEKMKQFLSPEAIQGYAQAAIGVGTSIADTVRGQKIEKEKAKAAIADIRSGGTGNVGGSSQSQVYTPAPTSDTDKILGMSKPIFFGGVGILVLVAGVGIFLATKGSGSASAPAK